MDTVKRDMTSDEMEKVNKFMLTFYQAKPSVVTEGKWKKTAPGVWVAAYCRFPADPKEKPELYMVHYLVDSPVTDSDPFVVYKKT